ncbi:exosortase family protein XrtF [Lutibacter sp.]|uniref:exosortase family protein XrtF n=1 Tax=Lutibacter sp. TaxID=1925666 RepID=UPI002733E7C1|nr:exosortase family protein XrtF [Lutibacter sp.]MDP3311733.1 exosortase family protein XrtF [Lutibacter sp.]
MQSNKTILLFLVKFFGTYLLLFLLYSIYLKNTQNTTIFSCDPITSNVAKQTNYLLKNLGYNISYEQHANELSVNLMINNHVIARVIEGCNAISIIILFIAFIISFANKFKPTFFFIIIGSSFIYIFNIFRIAIITIALYKYPEYEKFLHEILFPTLIYGATFLLWIIWVKKFSKIAK